MLEKVEKIKKKKVKIRTAKIMINRKPVANVGVEIPIKEKTVENQSKTEYCITAEMIPIKMPMIVPTMKLVVASINVL